MMGYHSIFHAVRTGHSGSLKLSLPHPKLITIKIKSSLEWNKRNYFWGSLIICIYCQCFVVIDC